MSPEGKKVQHNVLITAHRRELLLQKVLNSKFVREADNLVIAIDCPDGSQNDFLVRSNIFKVIEEASLPESTEIYEAKARLRLYAAMRRAIDYGFVKFSHLTILEEDYLPSEETKSYINQVRSILGKEQVYLCLSRHVRSSLIFKRNFVTKTRYPFVRGWHTSDDIWHKSRGLVEDIDYSPIC